MAALVDQVRALLTDLGIESTWVVEHDADRGMDYEATLRRGPDVQRYAASVKKRPTPVSAVSIRQDVQTQPLFVVGSALTPHRAELLRDARVQYVDVAGNAFLTFGGTHIDVRGKKPRRSTSRSDRSDAVEANLFSVKRSQVISVLLAKPELVDARLADVATAAGVSIALVHDTLDHLRHMDFLYASRLRRVDSLIDLWTAAYPGGLGRKLRLQEFTGDVDRELSPASKTATMPAMSGEAAVRHHLGRQRSLTVYVDAFDPVLAVSNRWKRVPDKGPNIFVRRKFWDDTLSDHDPSGRIIAPWPIVYADLMTDGDPRLREIGASWRQLHES